MEKSVSVYLYFIQSVRLILNVKSAKYIYIHQMILFYMYFI